MKRQILFVDDEPRVLEGLRRMLRGMRQEWDLILTCTAAEALEVLGEKRIDVVVSDMRMPGMDGAEFFTQVMERYPYIARIALSGQADEATLLRTVPRVHQFLSKPCDPERLRATIQRLCQLHDLLTDRNLEELVKGLKTIPSLPTLYKQIVAELQKESPSIKRVGEIISQDVGMTAKILQMVNSAFFGLRRRISNPGHAVNLLGLDTVKNLVLSIEVFSSIEDEALPAAVIDALWSHSMRVGMFARIIAKDERAATEICDDALGAGMLHDLGKLILLTNRRNDYLKVMKLCNESQLTTTEAESKVIGASHAELGAYLLGLWGLVDPVVEAVALHHAPAGDTATGFTALAAVHAANALEHEFTGTKAEGALDPRFLAQIGAAERVDAWRAACRTAIEAAGAESDAA